MAQPLVLLPSLDLLKTFVAVGRRMSVTQAADDLCLTQSAVSKQIRALEDLLGVSLFVRGFRKMSFSEEGQALFQAADRSVQQLQDAVAHISASRRKPVTVTGSTSVVSLWMLPRLGEFLSAHPEIDVRFSATNTVLELGHHIDLAVRYCSEKQAPLGAVKLFGETIAPVASPSLDICSLDRPEALRSATLLEFDVQGRPWLHWSDWLAARGWSTAAAKTLMHFNQYEQMIQAALDGRGVALGRLELLQPYLKDGQLQVLGTRSHPPSVAAYSFWLIRAESSPRDEVQRVAEWILASAPKPGEAGPARPCRTDA